MKKLTIALSTLLLTSIVAQAESIRGSFEVEGEIRHPSCSVSIRAIDFQTVSATSIPKYDDKSEWRNTRLEFNNCSLGLNTGNKTSFIDVSVLPGPQAGTTNYWGNSGTANGIGIELNIENSSITYQGTSDPIELPLNSAQNGLMIRSRIVNISNTMPQPGNIMLSIPLTAVYR